MTGGHLCGVVMVRVSNTVLRRSVGRAAARVATVLAVVVGASFPAVAGNSPQGDSAASWPVGWSAYRLSDGSTIRDVLDDENPDNADLSSGPCTGSGCQGPDPTVYYASDGTNAFFRIRIRTDPADATKGGLTGNAYLTQLAVGGVVRAVVGVDGKSASVDDVYTATAPGTTVTQVYTYPFTSPSAGMRVVPAGSGQYFLDYQVPIARITTASGGAITSTTPIQMFFGSSAAANLATINKDYMRGTSVSFTGLATVSLSPASLTTTSAAVHTSGPNPPNAGQPSSYGVTLTMTNGGGGELSGATATATLPAGVTLTSAPAGVTLSGSTLTWTAGTLLSGATGSVTVVLSVVPTAAGTTPLLSQVSASGTDVGTGGARSATAPALTVNAIQNAAPDATNDTVTATEDGSGSVDVLANDTDADGDALSIGTLSTPAHGTVTSAGGVVTYTPAPNYSGPDSFTYTACDPSNACDTATVTVTVTAVNDAPAAPPASAVSTPEDTPESGTLPGSTDPDGDPLTFAVVTAPEHGDLTVGPDGSFTYTPDPGYAGPDSFTYEVCDPSDVCAPATVTVTVTPVNDAPSAPPGDAFTTPEDTPHGGTLPGGTDPDGDALTFAVVTQPPHGVVSVEPDGGYTYTPDANYAGPDSFTYEVCDPADACAPATVTVTVTPVNDPPATPPAGSFTTPEDTPHGGTLPGSTDPEGDPLTYGGASDPAHGDVTVDADGAFTYTPDPDYAGPDSFTYTLCDPSSACATGTVTVTVTPVNDAPVMPPGDAFTTPEDTPHTATLPGSVDPDGDAVTFAAVTQPAHGTVTVQPDGDYTYTPDAHYHGPDSFTYAVCDPSDACAQATVTVTVTPVNDTPAGPSGASVTTAEDTPHSGALPGGTDADGDPLTFRVGTEPAHGDVTVGSDGSFTYTPDPDYAGPDSFTYEICDPSDACATVPVTVTVTPVDDVPVAAPASFSTPEDTPHSGALPAATDADGDALTYAVLTQPAHGSVTVQPDGDFTYTPDAHYAGPDSFTYEVCDPSDRCAQASVTGTVTPVNDVPVAPATTSFATPEDTPHSGTLPGGTDADGDALTFGGATDPAHGTVTVNGDGTFTYTPDGGYHGPDSFTYEVCDPSDACATVSVTVTVSPVNDTPAAPPDSAFTTAEDIAHSGTLPGGTDADGDALTLAVVTPPAHGTVTVQADGDYTYTPDPDYAGPDSFTYQACDPAGACSAPATVTVDVTPVNDPPVAVDDTATTPYLVPVTLDPAANDTDVEGGALTVTATDGAHGSVTVAGTNVTYTPDDGFSGTDTFSYTVCDTGGACDTGTVTVTVGAAPTVNRAPVADAGADRAVPSGTPVTLDGTGSTDPDLDLLTYEWVQTGGPAVTLTGANTATPSVAGVTGPATLTFELTVSDGLLTDTDTVTVTIAAAQTPAPPACEPVSVESDQGGVAIEVPCDAAAAPEVVAEPEHGTVVVLDSGAIRYVPNPGFTGTDTFTVRVCTVDGCGESVVTVVVRKGVVVRPAAPLPRTGAPTDLLVAAAFVMVLVGCAMQRKRVTA